VLPLFIVEPELWHLPDMSARHWAFARECLHDLKHELAALGQPLIVRVGDVTEVLDILSSCFQISALWSHEETGNQWTFARDKRVAMWCRAHGIPWHEIQQNGTQRRLKRRTGWAQSWDNLMAEKVTRVPELTPLSDLETGAIPTARDLQLSADPCPDRQAGGRKQAVACLYSFLHERGEHYQRAMSSPLEGANACSRLSPYLAWGVVSMREVAQATWNRQVVLNETQQGSIRNWRAALKSFSGRLHWHCHFIQKLEDEPRIEFENLHPAYDGLRNREPDRHHLAAWSEGETGLPFVDACMRSLTATGWLNFRMRAMVMAVASYHLWLDWRQPGAHLARHFTDYEPGIHWPQVQMQSGTTGINTVRIYNPVKQGYDQDPSGVFVRRWVPELAKIDDRYLHEPWKAENAGTVLGKDYPFPIINHLESAKDARQKIWGVRRGADFRAAAKSIQEKHGSRKQRVATRRRQTTKSTGKAQLTLNFGADRKA